LIKSIDFMINIIESDFRRLDLNLLLVFSALLRERSVTKAAQRLHVGQPALSASLARLRDFLGDELFVRTAAGMEPTARAEQLGIALKPLLEGLVQALLEPPVFEAAQSERTFTLGMSDILELALAPGLLALTTAEVPGVRLSLRAADQYDAPARLDAGELDLAIGTIEGTAARQRMLRLYEERFLCHYDPRRVHASTPITLDEYLAVPHLLTSFRGSSPASSTPRSLQSGASGVWFS
jgi:LysR family transcriptional activator of mexEF-oprN operon